MTGLRALLRRLGDTGWVGGVLIAITAVVTIYTLWLDSRG